MLNNIFILIMTLSIVIPVLNDCDKSKEHKELPEPVPILVPVPVPVPELEPEQEQEPELDLDPELELELEHKCQIINERILSDMPEISKYLKTYKDIIDSYNELSAYYNIMLNEHLEHLTVLATASEKCLNNTAQNLFKTWYKTFVAKEKTKLNDNYIVVLDKLDKFLSYNDNKITKFIKLNVESHLTYKQLIKKMVEYNSLFEEKKRDLNEFITGRMSIEEKAFKKFKSFAEQDIQTKIMEFIEIVEETNLKQKG